MAARFVRFLVRLAILTCITGISVSEAWAQAAPIHVPLPGGGTLKAYQFLPHQPHCYRLPVIVSGVGVGAVKIMQHHVFSQSLANRGFMVILFDPSNYPESLAPGPLEWDRYPGKIVGDLNQVVVAGRLFIGLEWYLKSFRALVDYASSLPYADPNRIALMGFSQPANAILTYACRDKRIKSVIWNYGGSPWVMPFDPLYLPPVLIFHGTADEVYDVKYARKLVCKLDFFGKDYEAYIYPGQKHLFNVYFDPRKETPHQNPIIFDSFNRLLAFLHRTLCIPVPQPQPKSANHR